MPRSQRGGICPPCEVKQPQDLHTVPHQVTSIATALMSVEKQQRYLFTKDTPITASLQIQKGRGGTRVPSMGGGGPGLPGPCRHRQDAPSSRDRMGSATTPPLWPPLPDGSHTRWASGRRALALHQPEIPHNANKPRFSIRFFSTWKTVVCDPMDCSPPSRLLCPRDSPGKNTGVGSHFLLQGIFPTQG